MKPSEIISEIINIKNILKQAQENANFLHNVCDGACFIKQFNSTKEVEVAMPMPTLGLIGDHMEEINFPLQACHTTLHIHEPAK